VNNNLNISIMKKTLYLLITFVAFFVTIGAQAQFRPIPGVVTDSFKIRYPNATAVTWSDKVSAFQAVFMVGTEKHVARYSKDGQWQSTTKKITKDAIPPQVKDGLSKSKYASSEWEIRDVTVRYEPGISTEYIILVAKSDVNKVNLTFNNEGQLLKDNKTL
jgi:hypothetical protein